MIATASKARRRLDPHFRTSPFVYGIMKWVVTRIMHLLYRYEVVGAENFALEGPAIVVVNHLHLLDPLAVAPISPRQIVTLAASKWRSNLLVGTVLRLAGVIFVRRGEVDREALRACQNVLSAGGMLAIAPEGTRSRTGQLQHAKAGVAYITMRTGATLLPVAVWGVEKLSMWFRFKRPTCYVAVGRPFRLSRPDGKITTDILREMADEVMIEIGRMLPSEYRGVYAETIAAVDAGESPESPFKWIERSGA
jgi:1-acyl-sn-glycerol-3-phosphate acyltransferase